MRVHFEDVGISRIILRWILKKQDGRGLDLSNTG
jgi:hypothetical protein